MVEKCSFPGGWEMRINTPLGQLPVDPCAYECIETHKNVTVYIMRCTKCGRIEIEWERNNTGEDEEDDVDDLEDY